MSGGHSRALITRELGSGSRRSLDEEPVPGVPAVEPVEGEGVKDYEPVDIGAQVEPSPSARGWYLL